MGLLTQLRAKHPLPRWAFFSELRNCTGYGSARTIDAMAFDTWPSGHGRRIAYEVKVSRADYQREIDDPDKRLWVENHCHQTWFVTPKGLLDPDELPTAWGLLEGTEKALRVRKIAAVREGVTDPPYTMVLSMLRRAAAELDSHIKRKFSFEGESITAQQLDALVTTKVVSKIDRLNAELEDVQKQQWKLRDTQALLVAPHAHLRALSGQHRYAQSETPPTVEEIDALIERAVTRRLESLAFAIREAHRKTGDLIAGLEGTSEDGQ